MLHRKSFTFGPFAENTWVLWNDDRACMIIDPGCSNPSEQHHLQTFISARGLFPELLINTHAHIDHILGNAFIHRTYGLIPHLHPEDLFIYQGAERYGAVWGIRLETPPEPILDLQPGVPLKLGSEELEVRFTPGHTPGEVSLVSHTSRFVIAGDVLFRQSIGRTDLPGGDYPTLIQSIKEKLLTLPDDYAVCPGHGEETTIGFERQGNPFLREED